MSASAPQPGEAGLGGRTSILIDLNHATGIAHLFRPDGKYIEARVSEPAPDSPVVRAVHLLGLPYVVATTDRGEDIAIELPTRADPAPLRGRPVVYLDQQAWSKLALAKHEPERLRPDDERDAALWLIDLAENWSVVLPYSGGVLVETAHWSDYERRRRLAATIASLSRGWQMLDPLAVRAAEFEHVLAVDKARWSLPRVWTLAPGAWAQARGLSHRSGEGLPPEHALTVDSIASTLAALSSILDVEATPRTDPTGWAEHWAALAAHVAETSKPRHLTERAVHGAIVGDARAELARAANAVGCSVQAFDTWLRSASRQDLGTLPALGLAREVTYLKIVNSAAKWESNDLTDIFYLVQACGYADAVVGERGFVTLVQQAQRRLRRPVNAYKTLGALRASEVLRDARPRPPAPPE
ncbi:hypothetical protein CBP52_16680 [Cellulomonas sp. PSBB021]|nr:hypothetical protein CBP52_16680 [Cellulomonas sp. PSBB021]